MASNKGGKRDPFDSLYFKNHIQEKKKNKIDFKEIALFTGSICFASILLFGIVQFTKKYDAVSEIDNKDESIVSDYTAENTTNNYVSSAESHMHDEQLSDDTTSSLIYEQESTTSDLSPPSTAADIPEDTTSNTDAPDNINITTAESINFYGAIKEITSSSHLSEETVGNVTHSYYPSKAVDNDLSTCWCEGKDDYGIGENLTISFDNTYSIRYITIWNGLCTNEELYWKNSRVHNIRITFSDGSSIDCEYQDGWENCKSTVKLPIAVETSSVNFQILDVYEGEKYRDTCISEISIY